MDIVEQVARLICKSRGADPDAPLTVGRYRQVEIDGILVDDQDAVTGERILETDSYALGWQGYAEIAGDIVNAVRQSDGIQ